MALIGDKDRFWEDDILEEYFRRTDPEARRLAGRELEYDPSDDYHYGMGDYAPIPAPIQPPRRSLPRRPGPMVSSESGGAHVPAPPPVIPVDPAIGMNANMDQMAPDFNVPMIPNNPGTPTIVRQIPIGPEHPMSKVAPEIRTEVHDPSTYEHDVPMEVVGFHPSATRGSNTLSATGRSPGISDQEIAIRKAEEEISPPRGRTSHLPEGTIVQEVGETDVPQFEATGLGMPPFAIPPGGLGRGTRSPGVNAEVRPTDGYPGMFPPLVEVPLEEDVMAFRPEPSRDMGNPDKQKFNEATQQWEYPDGKPAPDPYHGYSHEEIVESGEGPQWKEDSNLDQDQRAIYEHHKETLGPVMASNVASHYGKLARADAENYEINQKVGGKTYKGNGRWVNANGAATAAPIPQSKDLSVRKKDEFHKTAIFNANRTQAEHLAQQERIKNAPIHTPEELAYLRGESDYGKGGMSGSGMGLTARSRKGQMNRYGPNYIGAASKERERLDFEQGAGRFEGSAPMRSVGPDGTVTNQDRSVVNRDGTETFTVTKRGKTMQYTVAPNGQIVDGSVRYLSGDELSSNASGSQREYYESDVRDPRWRARNDPQLRRRHGSPEDVDRAVERSLPKRV